MKLAKTAILISSLNLIGHSNGKGQLLDGTKVGDGNVEHFDEHQPDNLANIGTQVEAYNMLLKRTGGVQNGPA